MLHRTNKISNSDDVIDSRDVIARIEELEGELSDLQEAADDAGDDAGDVLAVWRDANGTELKALQDLASEGESAADWPHGETLIRDSYFKDYAMQLADDLGCINADARWPNDCIDWDRAARELQMDYTAVDFDGVTYWLRS